MQVHPALRRLSISILVSAAFDSSISFMARA